jgi:hypothetical protein
MCNIPIDPADHLAMSQELVEHPHLEFVAYLHPDPPGIRIVSSGTK